MEGMPWTDLCALAADVIIHQLPGLVVAHTHKFTWACI